jgi:Doubled CXXCH motif (Paired_CXXCH_1)
VTNTATPTAQSCSYLTATDSEGQTVSLYGYKLLSAYPNHSWSSGPESWGTSNHSHDVSRWCGRCHNTAVDVSINASSTYHNHPTGCTSCHGNPNSMGSFDFPHTSSMAMLLKDYPDALCINCHTSGALP